MLMQVDASQYKFLISELAIKLASTCISGQSYLRARPSSSFFYLNIFVIALAQQQKSSSKELTIIVFYFLV